MRQWKPVTSLALLALSLSITACQEQRNNGGQAEDRQKLACVVATDFYMVHFTAYLEPTETERQDRKKAFSPYCQDLPRVGKAYLTVDLLDSDVKTTPISAKVIGRTTRGEEDLVSLPAKTYPTGIVEMAVELRDPGEYRVELSVGRSVAAEDTIRIPVHVATTPPALAQLTRVASALAAIGISASLALFGYRFWRRHHVQQAA